jgi:DNA-binding NtrC family response regulator
MKTYQPVRILISADKGVIGTILAESLVSAGFGTTVLDRDDSLFYELRGGTYYVLILTNTSLIPEEIIQMFVQIKYFHEDVKVIVLSGWTNDGFPERIMKIGASGFFPLPVSLEELTTCVKDIVLEKERSIL